ncbi:Rop family plasmid primer RNA-binding protein [Herbaspirillum sp. B65]|uniref:Rop family plasmid primer RNA-binding protein n=1 Tax=Herbaspirillum sp. B65 TaxID=137708 RepID=UPI003F89561E
MARFIRSQTLTLLEKLNELDADEQADICECAPGQSARRGGAVDTGRALRTRAPCRRA